MSELNEKYKSEIEKMKEMINLDYTNDINLLKIDNKSKLDELKNEYELKVNRLKDELKTDYENKIQELKEKYESELKYLDRSSPNESMSKDLCKKLQDQVERTKQLDKHLLKNINESSILESDIDQLNIPLEIKVFNFIFIS